MPISTIIGSVQVPPNRRSDNTPNRSMQGFSLRAWPWASPNDLSWPVGCQQSQTHQVSLAGWSPNLAHKEFDCTTDQMWFFSMTPPLFGWLASLTRPCSASFSSTCTQISPAVSSGPINHTPNLPHSEIRCPLWAAPDPHDLWPHPTLFLSSY